MAEELSKIEEEQKMLEQPIDKEKALQALLHLYELGEGEPSIDVVAFMRERRRRLRKSEK